MTDHEVQAVGRVLDCLRAEQESLPDNDSFTAEVLKSVEGLIERNLGPLMAPSDSQAA